jgi:hypothetical protein
MDYIKKTLLFLSSLKITLICLLFLCIFVIWGTFYQVEYGIHAAQERFFSSWILMINNFFPVPGVKTILTLLSINLLLTGLRSYLFRLEKFGIFLMHAGSAVLLIGSGISSFLVSESSLSLTEGDQSSVAIDFANWEFMSFVNNFNKNTDKNETFKTEFSAIKPGNILKFKNGTNIHIKKVYKNCDAFGASLTNIDSLQSKPVSKNRLENIPGIILSVSKKGVSDFRTPDILLYGGAGIPSTILLGQDTISLSIQPKQVKLPVSIRLVNFLKENHPGTNEAKSYESRIHARGPQLDREIVISMNKPFRYQSFTFYQSGYTQNENSQYISSLSVIENPARFVPYLAGLTIMIGLFFHFIIKFIYAYRRTRQKHE